MRTSRRRTEFARRTRNSRIALQENLRNLLRRHLTPAIPRGLEGLAATAKTCRVCEVRIEAEQTAVNTAATTVSDAVVCGKRLLPACCLPHLIQVAAFLGAGKPVQTLLHAHARLLERTAEDLQRYALRHDALRRYLTSEEERGASQLALLLLAGHRSVSAPWAVDYDPLAITVTRNA